MLEATVETAGTQGALWLRSLIPMNQIYTVAALLVYSAISLDAILWLLPLLTFYASFSVLVVVTAQMLQARRRLGDVRTIAAMLSRFTLFDEQTAASMFMWNSMKPYATFFIALPLCIASLTVADSGWLLCPEFAALSAVTSFVSFLALNDRYDHLALISIFVDLVSTVLPALIQKLPKIPVFHSIIWYLFGPGFALELPVRGLCIMIGLPSLAFLIVPLIFVKMAARGSWQGTYQTLVPHLVCFFWWRLTVAFLARSTWFGLARACVGWIGLIFLLPLAPFLLVGYGIYIFHSVMTLPSALKVVTTLVLIVGASTYAWWSRSGFRVGSWFSLKGKSPLSKAAVILVIVIASCVPLASVFVSAPASVDLANSDAAFLSWSSYHRYCLAPEGASVVACAKFTGAHVTSAGVVKQFAVSHVDNPAEAFAAWLPCPFSNWIRCAYGEHYPDNCSMNTDAEEFEACTFNKRRGRPCHLQQLDRFTFELVVAVDATDVRIVAADWFRTLAGRLQPQTQITFRALLSGAELKLESIDCVDKPCGVDGQMEYQQDSAAHWRALFLLGHAVRSVWNFFLRPLVAFSF